MQDFLNPAEIRLNIPTQQAFVQKVFPLKKFVVF
jgi:hypothetical protein